MLLSKRYDPKVTEPDIQKFWQRERFFHFDQDSDKPVYSIDTPPPTVSGKLHLGHVYSYSHTDFFARFHRMNGYNVFYPMGFDNNGLATEIFVENKLGTTAETLGRSKFIEKCLEESERAGEIYQSLWKRLGLSIDWRYTYQTIDRLSRRTAQLSFIDLYNKNLAYRKKAPTIWCPNCQTAIAQAELNDFERETEFITLRFPLNQTETNDPKPGDNILIATTRPELLPACVAIFVHPDDKRYTNLIGREAIVPLFGQKVPILDDPEAVPEKGTGAVMCCTFGDQMDVAWWYKHDLPLIEAIDKNGKITGKANGLAGLSVTDSRREVIATLEEKGFLSKRVPTVQSVRIHERCDTPVEYIVTNQWFIRVLDFKEDLLNVGENLDWFPANMVGRYQAWVANLNWDWCISRQRFYGVTFPVWYCSDCEQVVLANESELPIDPIEKIPDRPCHCGSTSFIPETDVMDTWATSALTPAIVGRWLTNKNLYQKVFPFSLRPQAHEIIRTWAFYTIVKSLYHFNQLPWKNVVISGWGLAGEGLPKLSKSRSDGSIPPLEMIELYSADAVRYWAASTGPGKDAIISEEKIQTGSKLITKIWNVARFSESFLKDYSPPAIEEWNFVEAALTPADRWMLSLTQRLIQRVTKLFKNYEYASAKFETEAYFWNMADNYLEMAKQRLYDSQNKQHDGARFTLYHVLLTTLHLFAPILPHVTEKLFIHIFSATCRSLSIHTSRWPAPDSKRISAEMEAVGELLLEIAVAVRRYKSERNLSLGAKLDRLQLATDDPKLAQHLYQACPDLTSITRAQSYEVTDRLDPKLDGLQTNGIVQVAVKLGEE